MRTAFLAFALIATTATLVASSDQAQALTIGDNDFATATVQFENVPNCKASIDPDICVMGYDSNGTSMDLSDDTIYAYQSTERIVASANTKPLEPTGLSKFLPRRIALNSKTTEIENPAFVMIGEAALSFNDSRPEAVKPFIEARHNENRTIFILRFDPVTKETPLPKNAGIPIWHNWDVTNYTHIRPLQDEAVEPRGTDYWVDDRFNASFAEKECRDPFGVPIEASAPGTCGGVAAGVSFANGGLKETLPNVVCCADTTGGDVVFRREPMVRTAAGQDGGGLAVIQDGGDGGPGSSSRGIEERFAGQSQELAVPHAVQSHGAPLALSEDRNGEGSAVAYPGGNQAVLILVGTLLAAFLAALYSRISRERVLDNQNRSRIFEWIIANPGVTVGEVARHLGLNYRTVERHVRKLQDSGLAVAYNEEGRRRLFENHDIFNARSKALLTHLRSPVARAIVERVLSTPQTIQSLLRKELGLPSSTVKHYISGLVRLLVGATETIEGWAHYCEELMFRHGFSSGPSVRFVQRKDQLWRACRIVIDHGIHAGGLSFEDSVRMLVGKTGMPEDGARAELKRYTQSPGYQLSYLLGKILIGEMRDNAVASGMGERSFRDRLLGAGSLPIALLPHEVSQTPGG